MVTDFEQKYAVNDKQDVLAMCALQFASRVEVNNIYNAQKISEVDEKLKELSDSLDTYL